MRRLNLEHRKILAEAADAASSDVDSGHFPDQSSDFVIVTDEIIEKDTPWDVTDLTSKGDRRSSRLLHIQELCQAHDLSVLSDLRSIPRVIKDELEVLASGGGDESSPVDLRESQAAKKAHLENLLVAFQEKLADAERHIQELEYNKNTLDDLATKVEEAEAKRKSFEEKVQFLEDRFSEQSNQFIEKDASLGGYPERVVVVEKDLTNALAEF